MHAAANRSRTLVKICGVRSADEAAEVFDLGADAVGVVIATGSPRQVSPSAALQIATTRPGRTVLVGRGDEPVWPDLARSWPGPVQIHGSGRDLTRAFIRALPAGTPPAPSEPRPVACLLDAPTAGSGTAWDWSRATSPWPDQPLILAGGLTPESVAHAIRSVHPWAVDVSSGVERARGRKDLDLVRVFVEAVRRCDASDGRVTDPSPTGFDALR
jgi:phosphoribosylanthranilate isomerase